MTARRPFASRGYARRRSPTTGSELGARVGIFALVGVLALVGVAVVWARDRLPADTPLAAPTQPPFRLVLATPTTQVAAAAPTVAELAMAAPIATTPPPPAAPTVAPTPMATLRQWAAASDGVQIDPVLVGQLDQALVGVEGTVSVAVKDLGSGRGAVLDGEHEMEAASLFKLTVMYAVFDAGLSLGEPLAVTAEARQYDAGTMELAADNGESLSVAEALERMITISDNTSAIMLASRVGSARITRNIGALGMESTHYSLERMTTSSADMLTLLERIARGEAVSSAASADMVHLLLRQRVNDRLPRLLPADVRVAHKTGNLPGIVNDVGVLYGPSSTVAVAALVSDTSNEAAAAAAIARVGLIASSYFEAQPEATARPLLPPQPARGIPATWREPRPTRVPTVEPEPTETPEPEPTPTLAPPTATPRPASPATSAPTLAPTLAGTPRPVAATSTSPPATRAPTAVPATPAPSATPRRAT